MQQMSGNFNLLDEAWIPVLWKNGEVSRIGIRTALSHAGSIRDIAASNPMDRFAVVRFLLSLLYWCRGPSPEGAGNIPMESFPAAWFSELEAHREYFILLGEGRRFYQYRNANEERLSVLYLIHETPVGTNIAHFRHTREGENGLCLPCCTLGLLRLPVFTTQGGKGKSPGINAKPPLYGLQTGMNLMQTLKINLARLPTGERTVEPAWIVPNTQLPPSGHVPLLIGLSWLPRRVWLDYPHEPVAPCAACGQTDKLVRFTVFGGLGSTKPETGLSRSWNDPQVLKTVIQQKNINSSIERPLYYRDALENIDAASGQWTGIIRGQWLESQGGDERSKTKKWIIGFASDQNKYLEASEWKFESQASDTASIDNFEQWRKAGNLLVTNIKSRIASLEATKTRKYSELRATLASIRPQVEYQVSGRIKKLLPGGTEAWQEAAKAWDPLLDAAAQSLAPGFTTAALTKRQCIRNARPVVNEPQEQDIPTASSNAEGGERDKHA